MVEQKATFEGWCIVELFGHQQIAGYVTEAAIGGGSFVRVDVPALDGQPAFTKFFGGAAIYAITPTTEEIATVAARHLSIRPVSPWIVPVARQLAPAVVDGGELSCADIAVFEAAERERQDKALEQARWREQEGLDL